MTVRNGDHFDVNIDPLLSFERELERATRIVTKDSNAMSLATNGLDGIPNVRIVLYKGLQNGGLSFYTNYNSTKSQEVVAVDKATALFFWPALDEQIRIRGEVQKLPRETNEKYFASRPRLSQIGAWASAQSKKLQSKDELDARVAQLEREYQGREIPCPPHWGGWTLVPIAIEFWFGQQGRLHDRYCFERNSVSSTEWNRFLKNP